MKAQQITIAAVASVIMLGGVMAHAQEAGMAYNWRAPGSYFGDPTPISDRDEASTSRSSFRIGFRAEPETDVRSRDILVGTYSVVPNPALGYAYAGFAIPFNTPMAFEEEAVYQFDARTDAPIERLELVLRDTSRRRATHVLSLDASPEWKTVTVPASALAAIDQEAIESAALVVLSAGEGNIEISKMHLPVRSLVQEISILEEIRTAPKWYLDAEFAVGVARRLERPVLVRVNHTDLAAEKRLDSPAWRTVLEQTVNVTLTADTLNSLPEGFEAMSVRSQDPLIFLFETDGTMMKDSTASDGDAAEMAAILSQRTQGKQQ